ncbi:hypothetical protein [Pseudoalteromonas prydzensis]|nr:hypothetical protein [Pseudoalteromonas prydzensis]
MELIKSLLRKGAALVVDGDKLRVNAQQCLINEQVTAFIKA